jgi:Phage tail lysozyme
MRLSDKITKAKNGLLYNNPYDMLDRGLQIPLTTALGYANGVQIGQGLGFDEQSQKNLGYASGFNNLLNSSASFIDTVRENKEAKKVARKAELDEYMKVAQERYTYNDFSVSPFETSYFKKGGEKKYSYQDGGVLPAPTFTLPNKKESHKTIIDKINKAALQKKSYDEILATIDNDLLLRDSLPLVESKQVYNPTTPEERMKTIGFQQGGIVNQNRMNVQSQLGYSTGSPFIEEPFLDINSPQGKIDMSNTALPLLAVDNTGYSKMLEPYSGQHQFKGNKIREYRFQDGGLVTFQQKADKWGLSLKGYAELVLTAPKGKFSQDIIKIAKQFSTKKYQDGGEVEEPDFYDPSTIEEEIWNADEVMTASTTEVDPFVSGQGVELNIDDIDFSKFVPEMQSPAGYASQVPYKEPKFSREQKEKGLQIKQGLIDRGFTNDEAAAIVGNLYAESGFKPHAVNPTSKAFGLAQWLGSRKKRLIEKAEQTGVAVDSLDLQLDFLKEELKGGNRYETAQFNKAMAAQTIEEKSHLFAKFVERPSEDELTKSLQRRVNTSKYFK